MAIRVALAEDQRMVREALGALLAREPDFTVVGQAATGREALKLSLAQQPDVLVLDISLLDMDGIEVARAVREQLPQTKVLALSVHTEPHIVHEMLKAGASGYVDKASAYDELVRGIRFVMQNKIYLSPDITREALGPHVAEDLGVPLSRRERQVLALLARGLRSQQIGDDLHISIGTVEVHRRNIMRKLGLHTVAELTRYAVRQGLISL